jgi:lysophospholipid acyltransferase (LPLAT)-like uncharacterized protein
VKSFLRRLIPYIVVPLYRILLFTWRIEVRGPATVVEKYARKGASAQPCVFAHWHGDELALIGYYAYRKLAVLSSHSEDGALMAKILGLLGYQVFRGSSSKGGARGLLELIRAVRGGSQAALAVDGPRGPRFEVKPGVVELAKRTKLPIVPVRVWCDRAWVFKRSWNQCFLPKPFARIVVEHANTIDVGTSDEKNELKTDEIKQSLLTLPCPPFHI